MSARRRADWSRRHAVRLFWRAGFGLTPAEADWWSTRTREHAVWWLLNGGRGPHGAVPMAGPKPIVDGRPLDPLNEWGHDRLWWLDRMVRSQRPLVERMTLFWHDHFATNGQETPLMLRQNRLLRRSSLGSFRTLLGGITVDPAMQQFLSLVDADADHPNENYARELMELFTLGAGNGYTEQDIREAARALTGFRGVRHESRPLRIRYDPKAHDAGVKTLFGRRGHLGWTDVLDAVVAHPAHPPFIVEKLWGHFVGERHMDRLTRRRLQRVYVRSGYSVRPVVRKILLHAALYEDLGDPQMVKWPAVYVAGMLRTTGRPVDSGDWAWLAEGTGQMLFSPPSVAGWDTGTAWMSTATMRSRFLAATNVCGAAPVKVLKDEAEPRWDPDEHLRRARSAAGDPWTSAVTDRELLALAREFLARGREQAGGSVPETVASVTQSALRHLLLSGPDNHLC